MVAWNDPELKVGTCIEAFLAFVSNDVSQKLKGNVEWSGAHLVWYGAHLEWSEADLDDRDFILYAYIVTP